MQAAGAAADQAGKGAADRENLVHKTPDGYKDPSAQGANDPQGQYARDAAGVTAAAGPMGLSKQAQDITKGIEGNKGMEMDKLMAEHPYAAIAAGAVLNALGPIATDSAKDGAIAAISARLATLGGQGIMKAGVTELARPPAAHPPAA